VSEEASKGDSGLSLLEREGIQAVVYGDPGIGKSDFVSSIASVERPLCVWVFDANKKAFPYYNPRRYEGRVLQPDVYEDKFGTQYREVTDAAGKLLVRLEFYHDADFEAPESAQRFMERVVKAQREHDKGQFWGYVLDSVTAASMKHRMFDKYIQNAGAKDGRQHYAAETDAMERILMQQLPQLSCTAIAVMHVSKADEKIEMEGSKVRAPLVRGRVFDQLATQWPEIYRLYVEKRDDGTKVRRLQTENDGKWMATSAMGMPDGTKASWAAMVKALKM
jgi:hypothetical protein